MKTPAKEDLVLIDLPDGSRKLLRAKDFDPAIGTVRTQVKSGELVDEGSISQARVRVRVPIFDAGLELTTCDKCGHTSSAPREPQVIGYEKSTMLLNAADYDAAIHGASIEDIPAGAAPA